MFCVHVVIQYSAMIKAGRVTYFKSPNELQLHSLTWLTQINYKLPVGSYFEVPNNVTLIWVASKKLYFFGHFV